MLRKSKIFILIAVMAIAAMTLLAGCGKGNQNKSQQNKSQTGLTGTVKASGSTALLPLVQQAKAEFEQANTGVTINPSAGGSFTGLKQVSEGAVDIGNSDVDVKMAKDVTNANQLVDHKVAVAPFIIAVNKDLNVDNLTQKQLVDIYTGKIKNWSEVGGPNEAIVIIHRPSSSGSRAVIKEVVMKGQEFPTVAGAIQADSSGTMLQSVEQNKGAIGYLDVAYLKKSTKIKALKYDGVAYSPENVYNGKYPVWAFEHMYTKGEAKGAVKAFIDYITGSGFQNKNLEQLGFLPVSKVKSK